MGFIGELRTVFEEVGLVVNDLKINNIYSGPNHFVKAENSDEHFVVTAVYFAETLHGEWTLDEPEPVSLDLFIPTRWNIERQ